MDHLMCPPIDHNHIELPSLLENGDIHKRIP